VIITACTVVLAGSTLSSTTGRERSSTGSVSPRPAQYAGPSLTNLRVLPSSTTVTIDATATTTTTTTTPPSRRPTPRGPSCASSYDRPECGPPHWDPPVVDQPATLTVAIDPPRPRVGDLVTFTFHWSDADADLPYFNFFPGSSTCAANTRGEACDSEPARRWAPPAPVDPAPPALPVGPTSCHPVASGPWSPPPPSGAGGYVTETIVYPTPGTYTWFGDLTTSSSMYAAWARLNPIATTCGLPDPYDSAARIMQEIVVAPAANTTAPNRPSSPTSTTTLPNSAPRR